MIELPSKLVAALRQHPDDTVRTVVADSLAEGNLELIGTTHVTVSELQRIWSTRRGIAQDAHQPIPGVDGFLEAIASLSLGQLLMQYSLKGPRRFASNIWIDHTTGEIIGLVTSACHVPDQRR